MEKMHRNKLIQTNLFTIAISMLAILSACQPTVMIESPDNCTIFLEGDEISFKAESVLLYEILIDDSFFWSSNLDGKIGNGQHVVVNNLTEGVHTITLSVTDAYGNIFSGEISITVLGNTITSGRQLIALLNHLTYEVDKGYGFLPIPII